MWIHPKQPRYPNTYYISVFSEVFLIYSPYNLCSITGNYVLRNVLLCAPLCKVLRKDKLLEDSLLLIGGSIGDSMPDCGNTDICVTSMLVTVRNTQWRPECYVSWEGRRVGTPPQIRCMISEATSQSINA